MRRPLSNFRDGVIGASACDDYYVYDFTACLEHLMFYISEKAANVISVVVASDSDGNSGSPIDAAQYLFVLVFAE